MHEKHVVQVHNDTHTLGSQGLYHWVKNLGETPRGRREAKGKRSEFESFTLPLKLEKTAVGRVNWYREVSIFEVQTNHPIVGAQKIPKEVDTLHLEMSINQPPVELSQVYHRALASVLFLDQKNIAEKTPRVRRRSTNGPF